MLKLRCKKYLETIKTKLKKFRKFNSLNKLDKKILNYMNFSDGFFIECGANDGVNQSNTWYLEKYLNWHGILIEPLKDTFMELKKNRSYNRVQLINSKFYDAFIKNQNVPEEILLQLEGILQKFKGTPLLNK